MSQVFESKKLIDICFIKPPKKESMTLLSENDLVSFVPMKNLGINQKYINLGEEKELKKVYSGYTYFKDNDVLLAKITPCFENGKLGIAKNLKNGIGFGSSEYIVYRPKNIDELNYEYLYYFLSQEKFREIGIPIMTGAVGHKRIPKEFYEEYMIPVFSIKEQKQIVEILDTAFEALEKAKKNIETNLKNTKELFDSKLNEIFSQKGEGWEEKTFGDVCEIIGGSQPPKPTFIYEPKENYIRLIQVRDYRTSKFVTYIPIEKAKKFCTKDDIMIGRYGPPIFGIFSGLEGAYNVALMKAVPDETVINKAFFKWFLKTNDLIKFVEKSSKRAAGQDGVRKDLLYKYPIFIPSINEQKQIVNKLDVLSKKTKQLEQKYQEKLDNLEELKKSLLQKAFNGELLYE